MTKHAVFGLFFLWLAALGTGCNETVNIVEIKPPTIASVSGCKLWGLSFILG